MTRLTGAKGSVQDTEVWTDYKDFIKEVKVFNENHKNLKYIGKIR
jgi:hypothetical protein